MHALKAQVLAYVDGQANLALAERAGRHERFADLPDELYALGEQMSPKGADLQTKVRSMNRILTESVKLAEAWPGEGPAQRIAAAVNTPQKGDPMPKTEQPMAQAEARPDIVLAQLANEIKAAEDCDYAEAMRLAEARNPEVAKRYREQFCSSESAANSSTGDRPDLELAELTKAKAAELGCSYAEADRLVLAENPELAEHYRSSNASASALSVKVKPPAGMRLITRRPDKEIADRVRVRMAADRSDRKTAERLVLAEDPGLGVRYRDFCAGRTALEETAYRASTIRQASRGRTSFDKAVSCALAEDPTLRESVGAYFEKITT